MLPSSWKLYLDDFPFSVSPLAHLEPELELFEVWYDGDVDDNLSHHYPVKPGNHKQLKRRNIIFAIKFKGFVKLELKTVDFGAHLQVVWRKKGPQSPILGF